MAKNSFPVMKSGGGLLAKLIGTLITLGVLVLIVKHPADAAHLLNNAFSALGNAADSVANFIQQLSK